MIDALLRHVCEAPLTLTAIVKSPIVNAIVLLAKYIASRLGFLPVVSTDYPLTLSFGLSTASRSPRKLITVALINGDRPW